MVNIAHASRLEKCKLLLKKAKKAKQKRKMEFNQLSLEEQQELTKQRRNYNLDEKLRLLMWDYESGQLPTNKYHYFRELIKEKLEREDNIKLKRILEAIK